MEDALFCSMAAPRTGFENVSSKSVRFSVVISQSNKPIEMIDDVAAGCQVTGQVATIDPDRLSRISVAYAIHSMRIGGAERSIARLINSLDHNRFAPLVVCLSRTGPAANWIEACDVPVIELGTRKAFDRSVIRRFAEVLEHHQVDVLHSHNWGTLIESHLARRRAKVPVHIHAERGSVLGAAEMRGLRMRVRGRMAGWAMRRCDAVVTNAHTVARRIEDRCGYPAENVYVIPNGVEAPDGLLSAEQASVRRRELGVPDGAVLLGSVGRLVPVKGFDLAIRALAKLMAEGRGYHLMFVGDGPEQERLTDLAVELAVSDRVHFAGHQDNVGPWLSLFDLYLNTSHSEGMSQSMVEALAAGCPVVATEVGDSAEVLGRNGECGRLVPPADVDALVGGIGELSSADCRLSLRGAAMRRHQQLFAAVQMAQRYAQLYRQMLAIRQGTRLSSAGNVHQ
ncbi:glycosyltransferase [Roseiconus nitratireducens]|uniref:Glycosyltransferase n=1 Tax=Roseiconus nitratireducens TaxID=2605748 RepID=A0A5M6DJ55_9BACT|nr:glycosyltransferase [Roseiconus nitratireducens]KAA5546282.1 glycosyltransferase [Roseiconus nitratireducens]